MLEDDKKEIRNQTELVLRDFLREISGTVHVNLDPMVPVLVLQIQDTGRLPEARLMGINWYYYNLLFMFYFFF